MQHERGKCVLVQMSLSGDKKQLEEISHWGKWTFWSWGTRFQCMWNKSEQDRLKDSRWYQKDQPYLGPDFSFYVTLIFSLRSTRFSQITSDTCPLALRKGRETAQGLPHSHFRGETAASTKSAPASSTSLHG